MADRAPLPLGGLLARFDQALLRPPALPSPGIAVADLLAQPPGPALLDWCHAGAHAPRSAELAGRGAQALAEALALQLDGSLRLQACRGLAARLALRLGVKCDDLAQALGRAPRRSDCWDSGWLIDGAGTAQRLARWQPRRATLLLVAGRPATGRQPLQAALAPPAAGWMRPVRLLWVHDGPDALAWRALG